MNAHDPRRQGDWFTEPTPQQRAMRAQLMREADRAQGRFGVGRRAFLGSSMGAAAAMWIAQRSAHARSEAEVNDGFSVPGDAVYEECETASFTRLDDSTAYDWELIEDATRGQQRAVQDTILGMLGNLAGLYAGFGVDQELHVTQTATRAHRANASDELILVALIHDAAKIISNANHPELIAAIARPYISEGGYRILRHHMEFQWKHYGAFILKPTDMRDRYVGMPWYDDAVLFSDEFDQNSFDPKYDTLPLAEFEPLVRQFFGTEPESRNRTADDC